MSESRDLKEIAGSPSTEASVRCFFYWLRGHRADYQVPNPLAPAHTPVRSGRHMARIFAGISDGSPCSIGMFHNQRTARAAGPASGQSRRFDRPPATSDLTRTTDIIRLTRLVRFVPISDIVLRDNAQWHPTRITGALLPSGSRLFRQWQYLK
jgi:hypothetical protein